MGFNGNAAVPRDELVLAFNTLRTLELRLSVVPVARVDDNGILVRSQVGLDTAPFAAERERNVLLLPLFVKSQGAVVPVAAVAAVGLEIRVARRKAQLVRSSPEVINGVLGDVGDDACGKRVSIGDQRTLCTGRVQRVVPDGPVVRVGKGIELEVRVLRQHERRLGGQRLCIDGDLPGVLRDFVRHAR